jgi:hypothetical protein
MNKILIVFAALFCVGCISNPISNGSGGGNIFVSEDTITYVTVVFKAEKYSRQIWLKESLDSVFCLNIYKKEKYTPILCIRNGLKELDSEKEVNIKVKNNTIIYISNEKINMNNIYDNFCKKYEVQQEFHFEKIITVLSDTTIVLD